MKKTIIAGALAIGLAAFALPAPGRAQPKLEATVGYYPGALVSLPALVASERKFFDRNGLTVELVPVSTGPAMTSGVASGSITFVNNSWDNLLVAVEQGLPVRGVAGSTARLPFAFIARKDLPLPHKAEGYPGVIKDLVGKNWGVLALGVSIQYIQQMLLTEAGFKANDATFIAAGLPNTARAALQRGTIDTYLSVEPLPTIVSATGEGTVIVDLSENQGPAIFHDLNYNGWWASTTTIRTKPQVVAGFVKAMEDAYCWYSAPENFDELVGIMQRFVKVPELNDDQFKAMARRLVPMFGPAVTARSIETWSTLLIQQKNLKTPRTRADVIADTAPETYSCAK